MRFCTVPPRRMRRTTESKARARPGSRTSSARWPGRGHAQVFQDFRGMLAQEHLAAATLPAQVVDVVDVADEVGLLEPDLVTVLVGLQWTLSTSTARAAGPWTARARGRERCRCAARRSAGGASRRLRSAGSRTSPGRAARHGGRRPWCRLSAAAQTRVAAASRDSPRSRAISSARRKRSPPRRPCQTSADRSATVSRSQPSRPSPATEEGEAAGVGDRQPAAVRAPRACRQDGAAARSRSLLPGPPGRGSRGGSPGAGARRRVRAGPPLQALGRTVRSTARSFRPSQRSHRRPSRVSSSRS